MTSFLKDYYLTHIFNPEDIFKAKDLSLQTPIEFNNLLKIYKVKSPLNILEIGTYKGGTLYNWIRNNS